MFQLLLFQPWPNLAALTATTSCIGGPSKHTKFLLTNDDMV